MLKTSRDPNVREVYEHRNTSQSGRKRWDYTKELEVRERDLYFRELVGHAQKREGCGLGWGASRKKRTKKEGVKDIIESLNEDELLLTLYDKSVQGKFLSWENTMQLDTSWQSLIYALGPELTKFHFNALHDVASTPCNLKLWNYSSTSSCALCSRNCNLKHILSCCPVALKQGRYNWRHDQVLRIIVDALLEKIDWANRKATVASKKKEWGKLKSAESTYKKPAKQLEAVPHLLETANDWKIVYDEDTRQRQFPQHIVCTSLRPDIVVYSDAIKCAVLIELTCGNEENFEDQRYRKEKRYQLLMESVQDAGWTGYLLTVEVGCRGFYHHTLPRVFNFFNLKRSRKKATLNTAAVVALKASYTIWLSRYNKIWCDNWELAKRPTSLMNAECLGPMKHV